MRRNLGPELRNEKFWIESYLRSEDEVEIRFECAGLIPPGEKRKGATVFGLSRLILCGYCPHPSNHLDGRIHQPSSWDILYRAILALATLKNVETTPTYRDSRLSPGANPNKADIFMPLPASCRYLLSKTKWNRVGNLVAFATILANNKQQ